MTEDSSIQSKRSSDAFEIETKCGLLCLHPRWMQRFANKRAFLLCFCTISVLQGMYFTYIVSVLSTLERLYQMPSRTMGLVLATSELGQIVGSLALAHFGGRGDRPKWIGAGVLTFAVASLLCSTPHFILQPPQLSNSLSSSNLSPLASSSINYLCNRNSSSLFDSSNLVCDDNDSKTNDSKHATFVATCMLTIASLLVGFGTTAVNTLGIPYIDDNVTSKESPLYFAITIGLRIFGPVFGFLLGSLCTNIYNNFPFAKPNDINPSDPQWIGAWWLGVFVIGWLLFFISFVIMSFPKRLPQTQAKKFSQVTDEYVNRPQQPLLTDSCCTTKEMKGDRKVRTLNNNELNEKEMLMNSSSNQIAELKLDQIEIKSTLNSSFVATIARLLRNRILLCRIASTVLHILPISGFYTFLPKYLENQFKLTAGDASFISGIAGILVMGVGIFSSGLVMRKFNPSPKLVSRWIAGITFLYAIGMLSLTTIGCEQSDLIASHSKWMSQQNSDVSINLNRDFCPTCNCREGQFHPICSSAGITYVSPCVAGCTAQTENSTSVNYSNCNCLQLINEHIVKPGMCETKCDKLIFYVLLFSFLALIHSSTEVGSMLITLRCVQPEDKAIALGLITFGGALLGSFPCPIIYGTLVDSTCLYWQRDCGPNGACRVFDNRLFRVYFHGLTGLLMFGAFLVDFTVCLMASKINFDDQPVVCEKQVPFVCVDSSNPKKESKNDSNNNDNLKPDILSIAQQQESPL